MNIGKLRERVDIQKAVRTENTTGEQTLAYVTIDKRRAWVKELSGQELFAAQQVNPEITHRVTMRYFPEVQADFRLLYRGRVLQVMNKPIDKRGRRREHEMLCKEITT